jgi:hypothetical protein
MTKAIVQINKSREAATNGFKIHPAADLFPMMTADELQELAADIAENGQQEPIIIDDGVLIDGRNRLEACKLAKVEPFFADMPKGRDPLAYIASANLMRRNLNKGQQAMALAMIYPESENGGRGKKSAAKNMLETSKFSRQRLDQARFVLHHSRTLAESVIRGTTPLDTALVKVKEEQQFQHSDEAKLDRLRQAAPDLAEQVNEERLKINEAIAALTVREQRIRQICDDARQAAQSIVGEFTAHVASIASGIENGEHITIPAKQIEQLRASYDIFRKLLAR